MVNTLGNVIGFGQKSGIYLYNDIRFDYYIVIRRTAMPDIYILKTDRNMEKGDFDRLLDCVSEEKKKRILRFHRYADAQRTLLGDVLARYAICKRSGAGDEKLGNLYKNLVFTANEYGKPLLLEPNGICFNISHSGSWVVCAVDDAAVGIDVEIIKPIDFKVAERFFSGNEYISLMNQPEETRPAYFYKLWTLKESYIKMIGKGLSIPLNSFTMNIQNCGIHVSVGNEAKGFHFDQSFLDSGTVYAVCAQNKDIHEDIYLNIESFLELLRGRIL